MAKPDPTQSSTAVKHYKTIVADPPWQYQRRDVKVPTRKRGVPEPYETMNLGDICALPVSDLADQSAHLYLWTTAEHLRASFAVVGAWGFTYRTTLVWCKKGLGLGGGAWRNSNEFILFADRGLMPPQRRDVGTWHVWPVKKGKHSAKPDEFYDLVETVSPGPYVELFARRGRLLWHYWGDQSLGTAEMPNAA